MRHVTIVTVPGYQGSGEAHWQSWLETQFDNIQRVQGIDWDLPQFFQWINALEQFIDNLPGPVILVGHSFGALVSASLADWRSDKVKGVILVAPASPLRFSLKGPRQDTETDIATFLPQQHIDSLGVLIGSETDHWLSFDDAKKLGKQWGLAFFNAGKAGHINSESGYGEWPLIKEFVDAVLEAVEPIPGDDIFHLGSWNQLRRSHVSTSIPLALSNEIVTYA